MVRLNIKGIAKAILSMVYLIVLFSCKSQKSLTKREIVVMIGCDDAEIVSDIRYSVSSLDSFLTANKIYVLELDSTANCGYLLKTSEKEKNINEVLTNSELMEECKVFFKP